MLSFKDFINEAKSIPNEPVPPGADPSLWDDPNGWESYRRFYKAGVGPNLQQSAIAPSPTQQMKPYGGNQQSLSTQAYQDISSIEAGVRSVMGRITGFGLRTGTIDMIKPVDMSLALAIEKAVQIGRGMRRPRLGESNLKIQPQSSEISAMEAGRGVHFYINKNGKTAFVIN